MKTFTLTGFCKVVGETMRRSVRVMIFNKGNILLIHRFKNGKEYYVLPGGGIEEDETPETAIIRETKEETNLDVSVKSEPEFEIKDDFGLHYYFLAKSFSGKLELGYPEKDRHSPENSYSPEWIDAKSIASLNILPPKLKEKLLERV